MKTIVAIGGGELGELETIPIDREIVKLSGKIFSHVKTRVYTPVSIYRAENEFLRIGPRDIIGEELALHKKLLEFDFPIPRILSEGEMDDQYYYIETSLGDTLLGDIFWEDMKRDGIVSDENFRKLLVLVEKFARAQLKTVEKRDSFESFSRGLHREYIIEELPYLQEKICASFEKLKMRTSVLPTVMTHGDFNPYNIFEAGVIDFGNAFDAPAGYDLMTNIYHSFLFPKDGDFEVTRRYEFSENQIAEYLSLIDSIYIENNLPMPSDFVEDFMFGRMIWSAVRMQKLPNIQKWRYEKFERVLEGYLADDGKVISVIKGL